MPRKIVMLLLSAVSAGALSACGSGSATTSSRPASTAGPTVPHSPRPESAINPIFSRPYTSAPASEQTHPSATPTHGSTTTVFTLHLTAREKLGPGRGVRYAYVILMRGPHPRCSVFTEVTIANKGAHVPVALRPPIQLGWCKGSFTGRVLLQTNVSCPPSTGATAAIHCTVVAPKLADAGRFTFSTS